MKRFGYLAILMVLSSSANAAGSYSFVVRGHRISVEATRHCRSLSCVSFHEARRERDGSDDPDAASAKPLAAAPVQAPALASAPAQAQPQRLTRAPAQFAVPPSILPANKPSVQTVVCASPQPATAAPSASATQPVAAPPRPRIQQPEILAVAAPAPRPPAAAQPTPVAAPPVVKASRDAEDEPEQTPLGDWQTEGSKGLVRIEQCGHALCGYVLNPSTNAVGETVLINMKPKAASEKAASQWSGNIFSRDSGNTYYATMKMNGPNSLRVEACALGSFFCSGNAWSRIAAPSEQLMSSGRISSAPPRS
jgi:uncharacterized protein (DUF2147 family)